jgi:hypothetical protein
MKGKIGRLRESSGMSWGARMHRRCVMLLGFFPALSGVADVPSNTTLCEANETAVFSCASSRAATDPEHFHTVPRRIISLCATAGITATSLRLIYRFGADKQHVELAYPTDGRVAREAFTSEFDASAKSSRWSVTFTRGQYSYTIYNRHAAYEENSRSNGGGVLISRRAERVADDWCDRDERNPDIRDDMWGIVHSLPEGGWDAPSWMGP